MAGDCAVSLNPDTMLTVAFDAIPLGLAVFDQQFRLARWNDLYFDLMTYPRQYAVVGTPFKDFITYNARIGEYGEGRIDELVQKRVDPANLLDYRDVEWPRLDGRILRLQRYPLKAGGLMVVISDLTEQRRRELRLQQSEARVKFLSESVEEGMILHDNRNVIDCNDAACRLLGAQRDWLLGIALRDLLDPDGYAALTILLQSQDEDRIETVIRRQDGSAVPIEILSRSVPSKYIGPVIAYDRRFPDQGQGPVLFDPVERQIQLDQTTVQVLLLRDLSERKRAEAERLKMETRLRQAQKLEAVGTLAGGIAHDFNNILGSVIGYAELLLDSLAIESRSYRHASEIFAAGNRAKQLVEQILSFSRTSKAKRRLFNLVDVIGQSADRLSASLPATVDLIVDVAIERAIIDADPSQIHQVIMNLAANAEQAMPAGGRLQLRLDRVTITDSLYFPSSQLVAGNYVRLAVQDTGCGIPEEIKSRIFDPFFTTKKPGSGAGLGLSVAHSITVGYGGAINISSDSDAGTTVEIYLPEIKGGLESLPEPKKLLAQGNGEIILVVDDDEHLMLLTEERLAELGYEAVGFCDPAAALAHFRDQPARFDLVITDLTMPAMTGIEFAAAIHRVAADIPVLLATGYADAMVAERSEAIAQAGIREILHKPLLGQELATSIAAVLSQSQQPAG